MIKTLFLSSVLFLTGCASGCREACVFGIGPGNSMFDSYAKHADTQDPCQMTGKREGYQFPNFCGASRGKVVHVMKSGNHYIVNTQ